MEKSSEEEQERGDVKEDAQTLAQNKRLRVAVFWLLSLLGHGGEVRWGCYCRQQ